MISNLISVIIPTRNRPDYLRHAVTSVLNQTYPHVELIIIDDGSDEDLTTEFAAQSPHIHYFRQPHRGTSAARNYGITQAKGEFIAFLDDDDGFYPEKLAHDIANLTKNPQIASQCSAFSFIDDKGTALPRQPVMPPASHVTLHDIACFAYISTSSVIIRRSALQQTGGFRESASISEDYQLWATLLTQGQGAGLRETLSYVRHHDRNTRPSCWALLRQNTRIIDQICDSQASDLQPREYYIRNLHRIIADNLRHKKQHARYTLFTLYCAIYRRINRPAHT